MTDFRQRPVMMQLAHATLLIAAAAALGASPSPETISGARWSLVSAASEAVIGVKESKPHGIGGYETGTFVKVGCWLGADCADCADGRVRACRACV